MSVLLTLAGSAVIFMAVVAILRGYDVRLAMLVAGFTLGLLAQDVTVVLKAFLSTLADEQYVLPICSAMGFAYVLRESGCDRQLVLLLTTPIRKLQFFLIPAAIGVAFFVNSAMISQASTAVAVGTVLIPLLRSAGLSSAVIGATLVLGASIGGELLNPGAPELQSIAKKLNPGGTLNIQPILAPLLSVQLVAATIVFWWLTSREPKADYEAPPKTERVNQLQALVPIFPLVVLMLVGPPFNVWRVPEEWLMNPGGPGKYASRLIAAAMLLGCLITTIAAPSIFHNLVRTFFEGVGYAFTNIVSIIVCANCFGKGIESLKMANWIGTWTKAHPDMVWPLAGSITMIFGVVSGSGMAATESLYRFFAQDGVSQDHNLAIGSVVSIAAAAGRTSSPAAAVVLLVSTLMDVKPVEILKRVAPPLVTATAVTAATGWWWWR